MLHYSCVLQADKYRRVSIFEFSHPENVPLLCILNYFVWGMLVNISSTLVMLQYPLETRVTFKEKGNEKILPFQYLRSMALLVNVVGWACRKRALSKY